NVARFARARETCKTSPASADSPRWNGNAKALGFRYQIFDVNILPSQLFGEMFVVFFDPVVGLLVLFGDERVVDLKMRWHSSFLRECPANFSLSLSFGIHRPRQRQTEVCRTPLISGIHPATRHQPESHDRSSSPGKANKIFTSRSDA